jgi:hypothetical protein
MVHSPFWPPLVWTLPSGIIAYGGMFGDITIVEPGEVEHRAGSTPDCRADLGRQHR